VNGDGEVVTKAILQSSEPTLTQELDPTLKAKFALKVSLHGGEAQMHQMLETSEGVMFRLLFTVVFMVKDGEQPIEEKILSSAFQVSANRKKNAKGKLQQLSRPPDSRNPARD
jgi:hypothetical protein